MKQRIGDCIVECNSLFERVAWDFRCANGRVWDLQHVAGTVNRESGGGTETHAYSFCVAGIETGVGIMVMNGSCTMCP